MVCITEKKWYLPLIIHKAVSDHSGLDFLWIHHVYVEIVKSHSENCSENQVKSMVWVGTPQLLNKYIISTQKFHNYNNNN